MKKRIASFLIAMVMLFSMLTAGTVRVRAESAMLTSDECIQLLKQEEGFSQTPYWDFTQYTVGFGTKCPDDMVAYYTQNGITEAEAETLLRNHLNAIEMDINTRIIDKYALVLTQNQFDALVLFSFNCGTSWVFDSAGTFHTAIAGGVTGNDLIRAFALWCSAGNQIRTFLLRRRLCEANLYLNNVYSQTPPENYCYVLYDGNGGTTSPRSQGYDSDLTATPYPVAVYPGYIFQGWYTAKTGGTKVEVLDATTKSMTLYAQWADGEGNAPPSNDATVENPVTVTVIADDVNLRQGPGTNYTRVGKANKGDTLVITETASCADYKWGKFEGGWIALQYTDYDAVVNGQPQEPTTPSEPTTPPETTPPETTPPETTPPETTPPETNPPETTPPETTPDPEPVKVTGTVNVKDWLRIRSGPGTSYSVAGYLKPNQKVEILEQSTVGSMTWGKIAEGWISMDYVILDNTSSGGNTENNTASTWSGKVIADELLIRTGPGTNHSIVGYLTYGTAVTVTEKQSDGTRPWGKTDRGWICLSYVQLNASDSSGTTDSGTTGGGTTGGGTTGGGTTGGGTSDTGSADTVTGYANVQDWLRIRTGPGTNYSIAGYLKPKEKVTITEQQTVGSMTWGKIASGWVSMDYIVLDSANSGSTTPQPETKTIVADCLRVRSGPGTNNTIVGYLYHGAKVQVLETATAADGSLWGKLSNGWISMDYAK